MLTSLWLLLPLAGSVRCASCQEVLRRSSVAAHFKLPESSLSELPAVENNVAGAASTAVEQDDTSAWQQVALPSALFAGPSASVSTSAAAAESDNGLALKPPFIPPCVNMEACPNGCEDPAHPGHVFSYSVSNRSAHQENCPERPIQCLWCKPSHSLPDSKLAAHVDSLLLHDATIRALAVSGLVTKCRHASTKPDSGHGATNSASVPAAAVPSTIGSGAQRPAASSAAAAAAAPASGASSRGQQLKRESSRCDCLSPSGIWRHGEILRLSALWGAYVHYIGSSDEVSHRSTLGIFAGLGSQLALVLHSLLAHCV